MWLGLSGRFRARWSAEIHDEWKRNLLMNRPDLTREQLDRTSALMDRAIPEALVIGHEPLVAGLSLPDADDRHVLAAAIHCKASVIVTFNERDFPAAALETYGIKAQHPDLFVDKLFDFDPAAVVAAAQRQRAQLRNPPLDADQLPRHPPAAGTRPHGKVARLLPGHPVNLRRLGCACNDRVAPHRHVSSSRYFQRSARHRLPERTHGIEERTGRRCIDLIGGSHRQSGVRGNRVVALRPA